MRITRRALSFSRCGASEVLGTARGKTPGGIASRRRFYNRAVGPASARSSLAHDRIAECAIRQANGEWRMANSEWKFLVSYSLLLFATRHSPLANKTRQAERRQTPPHQSAPFAVRRAPCGARCAYRRSTAALVAANQRRHSAPVRASWDVTSAAVTPPPSIPVQRSNRRPVVMPAGRFPEAARERR